MAGFKQIPQNFLFHKLLNYWGNMVRNYRDDCRDDDFFDVVRNCFDHDKAVELIEVAFSPAEITVMSRSKSRCNRLDLSDPLDDVFNALWNHEESRDKCRAVLDAIREYMLADSSERGPDVVEKRFADLKRVLKLDELESDILMFGLCIIDQCLQFGKTEIFIDAAMHIACIENINIISTFRLCAFLSCGVLRTGAAQQ